METDNKIETLETLVENNATEVSVTVNEALTEVMEWARATGNFVAEQTPLLAEEVIRWGIIENSLNAILGLLLLSFFGSLVYLAFKLTKGEKVDFETRLAVRIVASVVGFFAMLIPLDLFKTHLLLALQAWSAPRLYLMEYLSKLLN